MQVKNNTKFNRCSCGIYIDKDEITCPKCCDKLPEGEFEGIDDDYVPELEEAAQIANIGLDGEY